MASTSMIRDVCVCPVVYDDDGDGDCICATVAQIGQVQFTRSVETLCCHAEKEWYTFF